MDRTFALQRHFLNKYPEEILINDIQDNFPFLLYDTFLLKHYSTLMNIDSTVITKNFHPSCLKILSYFVTEAANMKKKFEVEETAIRLVAEHFKDNADSIFIKFEV